MEAMFRNRMNTISIHAPTRGATNNEYIVRMCVGISIHAPTRGATTHAPLYSPTHIISIHAPTRGAT